MNASQNFTACMGGFCTLRDKCRHHIDPTSRREPAERLCAKGAEQTMFFMPTPAFQLLPSQEIAP